MNNRVQRRVKKARQRTVQSATRPGGYRDWHHLEPASLFIKDLKDVVAASVGETDTTQQSTETLATPSIDSSKMPPQLGERLLLLILKKEERVNIPGDLAEEFTEIAARHGERFAKLWYYKQVAASSWPMIRKAVRWGLLASVGEWIRRII
ncbi:MAG: hypothetical protein WCD76_18845 [Pyrinomonadaceae bacterium]